MILPQIHVYGFYAHGPVIQSVVIYKRIIQQVILSLPMPIQQ
jgi:hypothetical protein